MFGDVEKQKVSKDDIFTSVIPVLWRLQTAYTENGVGTLNDEKHRQVACTGVVCIEYKKKMKQIRGRVQYSIISA